MSVLALKTIAKSLQGRVIGDADLTVDRLVHPADATGPRDLVLAFDKKLHPLLDNSPAAAVVLAEGQDDIAKKFKAAVMVGRPHLAMAKLTTLFRNRPEAQGGIHPSAVVDETAVLGRDVAIGPLCYVGAGARIGDGTRLESQVTVSADATLGKDCVLYAGVRIGENVTIGDRAIFHYNTVIGSDGFSFVTPEPGSVEMAKATTSGTVAAFNKQILRIHSLAAVTIGDDVEIGSCTAVDRGTITDTKIGDGTKIDNHVQIAHNVTIGENCLACGGVGIAGSSVIGDRVVLAARAGIADHLKIGDDSVLMAASQLGSNLPAKAIYMGFPAMPRERFMSQILHVARLKTMNTRLDSLEIRLNGLDQDDGPAGKGRRDDKKSEDVL